MKPFFREHVMKRQPGRCDEVDVTKARCLDPDLEAKWVAGKIAGLLEEDDSLHARDIVVYLPPKNRDYIQATDRAFRKAGLAFNLTQESSLSSCPFRSCCARCSRIQRADTKCQTSPGCSEQGSSCLIPAETKASTKEFVN